MWRQPAIRQMNSEHAHCRPVAMTPPVAAACVVLSLTLLLIGGSIYLLFRPDNLLMFGWADALGLSPFIHSLRQSLANVTPNSFVACCLPNALWTASYLLMIAAVVPARHKSGIVLWGYSLPLIALALEFLQLLPSIPGVFDPLDVLCYVLPMLAFTVYLRHEEVF